MSETQQVQTREDVVEALGGMLWLGRQGCIAHYQAETGTTQMQAEIDFGESLAAIAQDFSVEELVANSKFETDLKLLYAHFGGKIGKLFFEARLREFFPPDIVEVLVAKVYTEATDAFERVALFGLMRRTDEFFATQRLQGFQQALPLPHTQSNQGTETWLVSCPGCGLEKRVDRRTKRFRCKQCDFDQPFPFPE